MNGGMERRRHERRAIAENVFGYLDGNRVDGRSTDVSRGGAFVTMKQPDAIPKGALLGVVFDVAPAQATRIYLFGRVVRHGAEPAPGVGLMWERAATRGTAAHLESFLVDFLDLPVSEVGPAVTHDAERGVHLYFFQPDPALVERGDSPRDWNEPTAPVAPDALLKPFGDDPPPLREAPGPVTMQINVDGVHAPADLVGILVTKARPTPVTITSLGVKGAFVEVETGAAGPFDDLHLQLQVPFRDGSVPLDCTCALTAVEALRSRDRVGLDLAFRMIDEGGNPGVLRAYVRWLFLASMQQE